MDRQPMAVLMSGGVDSSVTALLLQQQGWDVVGVTMRVPTPSAAQDARFVASDDAVAVCQALGLAHYTVDVQQAFRTAVIQPFCDAYAEGRTPNPCVLCNPAIKFGLVWDCIQQELGIPALATGHYARVLRDHGCGHLARARFHQRDQSYFLYRLPAHRLAHLRLPLGDMVSKEETRQIARKADLPVAEREDSMEVCFVPDDDYRAFLNQPSIPGPIQDVEGNVIGEHPGIQNFTVGQRRWLGQAFGQPMYVLRILPATNAIMIGPREAAYQRRVLASRPCVHLSQALRTDACLRAKIRSGGEPKPCEVVEAGPEQLAVDFAEPVFAPTPGQHLVLYDEQERVVAGGEIVLA